MSERSDAPEGWGVRQRLPVLAALATIAMLAVLLLAAGTFYERKLRPKTIQPYATFPAPGVETAIHDGENDPHRAAKQPAGDPAIERAKRAVVAGGLPGWEARQ